MPDINLSDQIPASARWIKVRYEIKPIKDGADLIARVWSGSMDEAQTLRGAAGDVFIKLDKPQTLSYQRPVTVELKLKVVAYKDTDPTGS
jgi:hypothetical protein